MRADQAEERRKQEEKLSVYRRVASLQGPMFTGKVTVHIANGQPKLVDVSETVRESI